MQGNFKIKVTILFALILSISAPQVLAQNASSELVRYNDAIFDEIRTFIVELAGDLQRCPLLESWSDDDRYMLADLLVNAVANTTNPILRSHHSGRDDAVIIKLAEKQMMLILLSVPHWKPASDKVE